MKGKAKTHEQFVAELEKINPNIKVLGIYVNSYTKIEVMCKICGHVWKASPNHLLSKSNCPECTKEKQRLSVFEKFIEQLYEIHEGRIIYVSGFDGKAKKCKFLCTVCGHVWEAYPTNVINKRCGCPKCGYKHNSEKQMLPLAEMLKKLKEVHGDSIIYVGGYDGMMKKCKWRCALCGYEWEARPDHIINDASGCPFCVTSHMEKLVLDALEKKGIQPIHNQHLEGCFYPVTNYPISPDFIIETDKGKLCIETDGRQHFEPLFNDEQKFKLQWERDRYKDKVLKEKGYILIRVSSSTKFGTEKHITLKKLLELIEIGIDSETGEINFELFRQYDFNRE